MKYPKIAKELKKMVSLDQRMRFKIKPDQSWLKKLEEIDQKHTARVKEIITEIGWPSNSLVGKTGSGNAWLLVQHADLDPEFQSYCLELMKKLPKDQINQINLAYLEDRVKINHGRKQLYGTQFRKNDQGDWIPKDLEDPDNVDQRRINIGMDPIAEYKKLIEKMNS